MHFDVDVYLLVLSATALTSRLQGLSHPNAVVFDEVYYGQFVNLYVNGVFFFDDSGPPLGHMLLALGAYLGGFDGKFKWERIGTEYTSNVPVWHMRVIPAVAGSLVIPLAYLILLELGYSHMTACLAAVLLLLDNALLTQSRFMLMESMLICFSFLAIVAFLKFRSTQKTRPFSRAWWAWLLLCGMAMSVAVGIKYVGLFTCFLLMIFGATETWGIIGDRSLSHLRITCHILAQLLGMVVWPAVLYLSMFCLHFNLLWHAGPHDHMMTSAFQASLEGGLARVTQGQPPVIAYGSQVTLRSTHHQPLPCWLHSHQELYPIMYQDGRGSSHQQQVTCYPFKDVNNWWIVKDPRRQSTYVDIPPHPVRHGDIIQLIHGMSGKTLNSHNVAAPVTPTCQEVSCYVDHNISMPAQTYWRVDLAKHEGREVWKTITSQVKLFHVNTTAVLKLSGVHLPDWAFRQLEVVADRAVSLHQDNMLWNVEEHRYGLSQEKHELKRELSSPLSTATAEELSFLQKFWELQSKMLTVRSHEQEHKYSSTALQWLTLDTSIAYWMHPKSNAQIHLLPNPVIWGSGSLALIAYLVTLIFYLLRRRRCIYDIPEGLWEQFSITGWVLAGGWMFNFLPYLLTDKPLFLYHYLPAATLQTLLIPAMLSHFADCFLRSKISRHLLTALTLAILASAIQKHRMLCPLSLGFPPLQSHELAQLQELHSWELLIRQQRTPGPM